LNHRPNIVILILDAVRAKSFSPYQTTHRGTHFLDELAAESTLFRRAYSTSTWTIPTHASMLSGLYLSQHRIENTRANRYFNEAIIPLPNALKNHGYTTAAFSQNTLFSPRYFLNSSPDEFFSDEAFPYTLKNSFTTRSPRNKLAKSFHTVSRYVDKVFRLRWFLNQMIQWIETPTEPFFMICNIANAHYPWAPSPGILIKKVGFRKLKSAFREDHFTLKPFQYNSGKLKATSLQREMWKLLYEAATTHVEKELGHFIRKLRKWKGWENTILVVTADHGEMLGEHKGIVGHTLTLHDNLIHVPLIIRHPDYPKGQIVEGVVQNLDLYPTALEWADYPTREIPAAQLQRPTLSGATAEPLETDGYAFAGLKKVNPSLSPHRFPSQQIAVRSAFWKYIWRNDGIEELYDMIQDPDEKMNLAPVAEGRAANILRDHKQALEDWRDNLTLFPPRRRSDAEPEMSEEFRSRLRELGYLE
jgi:arylsulfatase A-like enzyme